jgi:hypothetical protein
MLFYPGEQTARPLVSLGTIANSFPQLSVEEAIRAYFGLWKSTSFYVARMSSPSYPLSLGEALESAEEPLVLVSGWSLFASSWLAVVIMIDTFLGGFLFIALAVSQVSLESIAFLTITIISSCSFLLSLMAALLVQSQLNTVQSMFSTNPDRGFILFLQVVHYRVFLLILSFLLTCCGLICLFVDFFLVVFVEGNPGASIGLGVLLLCVMLGSVLMIWTQTADIGKKFIVALEMNPIDRLAKKDL